MTHFKFATVFALGLTVGTLAAEAGDRSAGTRTGVAKSADPTFTITARSSGAPGWSYWCAAGRYVVRTLGLPWNTRITIAQGRTRGAAGGRAETVVFTTDPASLGIETTGGSNSINRMEVGMTMSANRATGFCSYNAGTGR